MNRSHVATLNALPGCKVAALGAEQAPSRFKLLNWGENPSTKGKFVVNETTLATLPANQRTLGYERVALDFEHNTVPGSPEYNRTQEPRPVAGFGGIEVIAGDGLYMNSIGWRDAEARKNFEDLSPTVGTNSSGEVTFVHSVALCRNGAVFDLTIENATTLSAILQTDNSKEKNNMNLTLVWLAAALALPETSTEADVKKRFTELNALDARLKALEDLKLTTLTSGDQSLAARLKKIEDAHAATATLETSNLVALFAEQGKAPKKEDGSVYSTDELKKLDVPTLKLLHANTSGVVPLAARTRTLSAGGGAPTVTALNAAISKYRNENGVDFHTAYNAVRDAQPALFAV